MLGKLVLLGLVASVYTRPQETLEINGYIYVPDDRCPPTEIHHLLPHEYDCTKYYYCEYGLRHELPRDCAPGTAFCIDEGVCVHELQANCTPSEAPVTTTLLQEPTTTTTTTQVPTTTTTTTEEPCLNCSCPVCPTTTTTQDPISRTKVDTTTTAPLCPECPPCPEVTQEPPTTTTWAPPEVTLPNGCPKDFGIAHLLPHETECYLYYQCEFGEKVERLCPSGTHFVFELQACDHIESANCTLPGISSSVPPTSSTEAPGSTTANLPGVTLPNGCPADFEEELLLPHETDCDLYYQCVHGNKVVMPCAPGTHFVFEWQVCEYIANANCTLPGATSTAAPSQTPCPECPPCPECSTNTTQAPSSTTQATTITVSTESTTTNAPESSTASSTESTATNSTESTTTNVPTTASTNAPESSTTTSAESTTTNNPSSTSTPESSTTNQPGVTLPNGCPADFGELLLPHETECDLYYQCVQGNKVARPCAPGTHFVFEQQACDHIALANCTLSGTTSTTETASTTTTVPITSTTSTSESSTTSAPVTTTTSSPESSTTSAPLTTTTTAPEFSTTNSPGVTLPNGCPADFSELLLPHETECDLYYQCVHGNIIARPCAPGTHFVFEFQACDHIALANCTLSGTTSTTETATTTTSASVTSTTSTSESSTTSAPVTSTTSASESTTTNTTVTLTTNGESSTTNTPGVTLPNGCPADFGELLLPHETECDLYYQCVHGNKVARPCAPGTHFVFEQQACDHIALANCSLSGTTSTTETVSTTTTSAPITSTTSTSESSTTSAPVTTTTSAPVTTTTTAPESSTTNSPGVTLPNGCPADFSELLLPHETECDLYYQCVHGNIIARPCAPGTHFVFEFQACDHIALANCTLSGTTSTTETATTTTSAPVTSTTSTSESSTTSAPVNTTTSAPESSTTSAPVTPTTSAPESSTTNSPGVTLPNGCPADFGELLLPHETECDLYYQCVHGNKVARPCAPGTHFVFEQQACDHIALANCSLSGTTSTTETASTTTSAPVTSTTSTSESSTSSAPVTTTTSAPESSTTSAPVTTTTSAPESSTTNSPGVTLPNGCPADFGELLLPHETECDLYYQCVHGNKVARPCAPGTHFVFEQQACDHIALANCSLSGTTSTTETASTTTSAPVTSTTSTSESSTSSAPVTTTTSAPESSTTSAPVTTTTSAPESSTTNSPGVTLPNGCPADFGELLLPHETECDLYYQCVHGNKVARPCAPGTHFVFEQQACDHIALANCSLSGTTSTTETASTTTSAPVTSTTSTSESSTSSAPVTTTTSAPESSTTSAPVTTTTSAPESSTTNSPGVTLPNGCPADFGELLLPHETECDLYYQCVHGNKVARPCAPGTHFVFEQQACDHIALANCSLSGTTSTTETASTTTSAPVTSTTSTSESSTSSAPVTTTTSAPESSTTSAPVTTTTSAPESSTTNSPGVTLPNGCPADFGELLLPHETECDLYYQCVHGNKVARPCAPGTHFVFEQQACEHIALANCTLSGSTSTTETATSTTSTSESSTTSAPVTITTSAIESSTTNAPESTTTNTTITSTTNAPESTTTNTTISSTTSATVTTTTTSAPVTTTTNAPEGSTTNSPVVTLPNGCPADFGEELLLPHETECDLYYQCVHGNKVTRLCAPGTHFVFELQVCDHIALANCTLPGGTSTSVLPTSPQEPSTIITEAPPILPNGCPADFDQQKLLSHETECHLFYYCVFGETVLRECESGKYFDYEKQDCDWSWNVDCDNDVDGSGDIGDNICSCNCNNDCGSGDSADKSGECSCGETEAVEEDPCKDGCHVPHWAHATDCDKFWRCDGDQKVLGVCSEGLHFNVATLTCDYMCNVDCIRQAVQSTAERDGLKVFLPWQKVDDLIKLTKGSGISRAMFTELYKKHKEE